MENILRRNSLSYIALRIILLGGALSAQSLLYPTSTIPIERGSPEAAM